MKLLDYILQDMDDSDELIEIDSLRKMLEDNKILLSDLDMPELEEEELN